MKLKDTGLERVLSGGVLALWLMEYLMVQKMRELGIEEILLLLLSRKFW